MGEIVFSQNVFKACDAWSVPNDRVHSWQPWILPALPVGTGVPRGCELEGWFQAESVCLGDRHAPPGGRASGTRWASSPPSDQWRRDTQRRGGHVRRSRRLEDVATNPGTPGAPETGRAGSDAPPEPTAGDLVLLTLDFRLLAPRTGRQSISVVLSLPATPVCGRRYQNPTWDTQ